jgi:hypothetical protein
VKGAVVDVRRILGIVSFGFAGCIGLMAGLLVVALGREYGWSIDVPTVFVLIVLPAAAVAGLAWCGWSLLRPP